MTAQSAMGMSGSSASRVLGRKMDSIPFSAYQVLIIFILALVGFIEGYDLFMTGSLLVLAKAPLHLTGTDIQWLLLGPALMGTIGGFGFSAVGDRLSRKAMLLIGVIATTFFTLSDPVGTECRAAADPAVVDRPRRRRRVVGGVSRSPPN